MGRVEEGGYDFSGKGGRGNGMTNFDGQPLLLAFPSFPSTVASAQVKSVLIRIEGTIRKKADQLAGMHK